MMKQASLLILLCALFSFPAVAQSTTNVEKNTKRITITTKKIDDNGQTITETFIAEGENPEEILEKMAINPEVIQQVKIEGDLRATDEERLFLIRSAGDNVVIEGTLSDKADLEDIKEIIVTGKIEDGTGLTESKKIMNVYHGGGRGGWVRGYVGETPKKNCAALGVFIGQREEVFGARISGIIEKGGAQEAGLRQGDIIKKIDEFEVTDYPTLFFALSHYRAGDEVLVRYEREDQYHNVNVILKDWAQLPGFEYNARTDCGQPELPADNEPKRDNVDEPTSVPEFQLLELTDARIFPNPSDGQFSFSFNTKPGTLFVSVTDAQGKVVFREQNDNATGYYNRNIDIKDTPQGNYIISVTQDDKVFTQQISKQ